MNEPVKTRAFAALEISDKAKEEISRLVSILKCHTGDNVKWVDPGSMHVTIKFFGDVSRTEISVISSVLEKAACVNSPFEMFLGKVGVFPDWRAPKVVWVGIGGGKEEISRIAGSVGTLLISHGLKTEKKAFLPHITIGRVKSYAKIAFIKTAESKIKILPAPSLIDHITLFKSDLVPEGAVHTPLKSFRFNSN